MSVKIEPQVGHFKLLGHLVIFFHSQPLAILANYNHSALNDETWDDKKLAESSKKIKKMGKKPKRSPPSELGHPVDRQAGVPLCLLALVGEAQVHLGGGPQRVGLQR